METINSRSVIDSNGAEPKVDDDDYYEHYITLVTYHHCCVTVTESETKKD